MVHKKYIKKNGKTFGPYLYENYRENGKTKTRYMGIGKEDSEGMGKKGKSGKKGGNSKKGLDIHHVFWTSLLIIFLVLVFSVGGFLLSGGLGENELKGELPSQSVDVTLNLMGNAPPVITNLDEEIFVCENTALNNLFAVEDLNADALSLQLDNNVEGLFFVRPSSISAGNVYSDVELVSLRRIIKSDFDNLNEGWKTHSVIVSVDDGDEMDSEEVDITLIEVNNPPEILNSDSMTFEIWIKGENSTLDHNVLVLDREDGSGSSEEITFSLNWLEDELIGREELFGINDEGLMEFAPSLEDIGVYHITVCVNDSGLDKTAHENIELCLEGNPAQSNENSGSCEVLQLTITDRNRAPEIVSYYPIENNFNVNGNDVLVFNITKNDADGGIPDAYWYVDEELKEMDKGEDIDEFIFSFGCGVSGEHKVKAEISDGLLNNSVEWNISVNAVTCPTPNPGGGSSTGGGVSFCNEKWACHQWKECSNFENNQGGLSDEAKLLVQERCDSLDYNTEFCGFQEKECSDLNKCGSFKDIPATIRECYYTVNPNCEDGIKNCHDGSCEVLVDCGGSCNACPTCFDNIKNQDEIGVDCGGSCNECPETPLAPLVFKGIISVSFILLLILVILLIINQSYKYFKIKKESRKTPGKYFKKYSMVFLVFFMGVVVLSFIIGGLGIIGSDRIVLEESAGFGTYSVLNPVIRGLGNLFSINVITTIVELGADSKLTVWDDTDDSEIEKYSYCEIGVEYCSEKGKRDSSYWDVKFYVNYSDINGGPIVGSICEIVFDNEAPIVMEYSSGTTLWEYTRNFNDKGDKDYEVSCYEENHDPLEIGTNVYITNTEPFVVKEPNGHLRGSLKCIEDIVCYYDFDVNVSEDDLSDKDNLFYSFSELNTTLTNFTIDEDGYLTVNVTHSDYTGVGVGENGDGKTIQLTVSDGEGSISSAILDVEIEEVNDAPVFTNLENKEFNMTELFEYTILIEDEEENYLLEDFKVDFLDCTPADWSDRVDCDLFGETDYLFDEISNLLEISFTPSRNDVGNYTINFSISDSSIPGSMHLLGNSIRSHVVVFNVSVINEAPVFEYVCDNEREGVEDVALNCVIRAKDEQEQKALIFYSNLSWFLDEQEVDCDVSTNYLAEIVSVMTPSDIHVGNHSINISVMDSGNPSKINSTEIWFNIENEDDEVILNDINHENIVGNVYSDYVGNEISININASDEDLLIPLSNKPEVYQEEISFSVEDLEGNEIDWINILHWVVGEGENIARASLKIGADLAPGYYEINIIAKDKNEFSESVKQLDIEILGNSAPSWNDVEIYDYELTEDDGFYLDISSFVSDADGEGVIFGIGEDRGDSFPSFSLTENGIISFTPGDLDVGFYAVEIIADDGKSPVGRIFNLDIENINDVPIIVLPLSFDNVSGVGPYSVVEDDFVGIYVFVQDDDYMIPQKDYYDEDVNFEVSIVGENNELFSFVGDVNYPESGGNLIKYDANFIPEKSDVGEYSININVEDLNAESDSYVFDLSVFEVPHNPTLMEFDNYSSKPGEEFYLDINASDKEDGEDDSGNLVYSYEFLEGDDFINYDESVFNSVNGELSKSFDVNDIGKYHLNITVTDSENLEDSGDFWIFVYGDVDGNLGCGLDLKENIISEIRFSGNHEVGNNLSYNFYINQSLRESISSFGDGRNIVMNFTPSFEDESYESILKNFSLLIFNSVYPELNKSVSCNVEIEHTNAPVNFSGFIGDKATTYNNEIEIDLKDYFYDADREDSYYNQEMEVVISSSDIAMRMGDNWTLILSSTGVIKEIINISVSDGEYNAMSNDFEIEFFKPPVIVVSSPSSGGSTTSTSGSVIALKLIAPKSVSAFEGDRVEIPLVLENSGKGDFKEIKLTSSAYKDGSIANRVETSLGKDSFEILKSGEKEEFNLSVFFDTDKIGDYEIFVRLNSKSPKYSDWAKIHINLQRINESEVKELILFTEEFIVKNPECIEITELINDANRFFENGDYSSAKLKSEEAIDSCENAISQVSYPKLRGSVPIVVWYFVVAVILSIVAGVVYYIIKRRKFKKVKVPKSIKGDFEQSYKKV